MTAMSLLAVDEATVIKGDGVRVLDCLSLSIAVGEHTVLLGANGSGKTSLIRLLTRLDWPLLHADGRPVVTIFGRARWNVFELRRLLGIVTPEMDRDFMAGQVSGLEAVVSGFFAARGLWHHAVTAEMETAGHAALDRLGVAHLAPRGLDTMSTGEVRRILIARALVTQPRALLLDEPTAGLDLVARRAFLEDLRHLAQAGTTVLLVTHHVEEIIPEIGRVVLLAGGRKVADGTKGEVLTAANLGRTLGANVALRERHGWYGAELH